jgi:hypothetical protein
MGITTAGADFVKTDAELFTKFIHCIGGVEYIYDISSGKNLELSSVKSRHRVAECKLVLSAALAESKINVAVTVRPRSGNIRCFLGP